MTKTKTIWRVSLGDVEVTNLPCIRSMEDIGKRALGMDFLGKIDGEEFDDRETAEGVYEDAKKDLSRPQYHKTPNPYYLAQLLTIEKVTRTLDEDGETADEFAQVVAAASWGVEEKAAFVF